MKPYESNETVKLTFSSLNSVLLIILKHPTIFSIVIIPPFVVQHVFFSLLKVVLTQCLNATVANMHQYPMLIENYGIQRVN